MGYIRYWIQDRGNDALRDRFGLRPDEALALALIPVTYWLLLDWIGLGALQQMSTGAHVFIVLVSTLCAYIVVERTPYYLTPFVITARTLRYAAVYPRMPLTGSAARSWPGIDDVTEVEIGADAAEETFGPADDTDGDDESGGVSGPMGMIHRGSTRTALIRVADRRTTTFGGQAWTEAAAEFAAQYENELAKDGIDASIYVLTDYPDATEHTEAIDDVHAAGDPEADTTLYAAEASNATKEQVNESGVMDAAVYAAVSVSSSEVTGGGLRRIQDRVGDDVDLDARAADRLEDKVRAAFAVAARSGHEATLLDGDGAGDVLRSCWETEEPRSVGEDAVSVTDDVVAGEEMAVNEDVRAVRENGADVESEDEDGADGHTEPTDGESTGTGRLTRVFRAALGLRARAEAFAERLRDADRNMLWGPNYIDEKTTAVKVGDEWATTLWLTSGPEEPAPGILADLRQAEGIRYALALHTDSPDRRSTAGDLDDRASALKRRVRSAGSDDDDVRAEDAASLREKLLALRNILLGKGEYDPQEPAQIAVYVTLRAPSKERLEEVREEFVKRGRHSSTGIEFAPAHSYQKYALRATCPTGEDKLNGKMRSRLSEGIERFLNLNTSLGVDSRFLVPVDTLGCFIPWTGGVRSDDDGVIYGMALADHPTLGDLAPAGLLRVARENMSAPHRYFIGRTGSGKTFFVTASLIYELLVSRLPGRTRKRAIILDIAENFEGVVKLFGGQRIKAGETTLNPFAVSPGGLPLDDVVTLVTDMVVIYLRENATEEFASDARPIIQELVRMTANTHGITDDPETHSRPSVTFETFFDVLEAVADEDDDSLRREATLRQTDIEMKEFRETAGKLLTRLTAFKAGNEFDFLVADVRDADERESGIDPSASVVLFDMNRYQGRDDAAKPMVTTAILSVALRWATLTDDDVVTTIDEAHDVFDEGEQSDRLEAVVRAGRNAGVYFDFLSQAGRDFDADSAENIADQCGIASAFDMGTLVDPEEVSRILGLPMHMAREVCGGIEAGEGSEDFSEVVVNVDGDVYRTRFTVSDVMAAVIEYRESRDGEWTDYLNRAILDAHGEPPTASPETSADDPTAADDTAEEQEVSA